MIYVWDVGCVCAPVCGSGEPRDRKNQHDQDDDSGSHYDSQQECGKRQPDHFYFIFSVYTYIFYFVFLSVVVYAPRSAKLKQLEPDTQILTHTPCCIYHIIDSCMWQVKNFFHVAFALLVSEAVFYLSFFPLWFVWAASFSDHPWNHFGLPVSGSKSDFSFCILVFGLFWVLGFC